MHRLRAGEWVAMLGSVGLLVMLFLDWFGVHLGPVPDVAPASSDSGGGIANLIQLEVQRGSLTGWSTLGWLMLVLLCVSIFGGLALSYMTARRTAPAWPVGASVLTLTFGSIVFVILAIRLLVLAGDDGPVAIGVRWPAYAGLVFAALIPVGAWFALRDDRTHTAESRAYTPPPPRPVPGTTAG
jgi:hypothetical protein